MLKFTAGAMYLVYMYGLFSALSYLPPEVPVEIWLFFTVAMLLGGWVSLAIILKD